MDAWSIFWYTIVISEVVGILSVLVLRWVTRARFPTPVGPFKDLCTARTRISGPFGTHCQIVFPGERPSILYRLFDLVTFGIFTRRGKNSYTRLEMVDAMSEGFLKSRLPKWMPVFVCRWIARLLVAQRSHPCWPGDKPLSKFCSILDGEDKGWPIVIFSHGLFGSADMYLNAARQIASTGCVVILPEHEDGSAISAWTSDGEKIVYKEPSYSSVGATSAPFGGPMSETFAEQIAKFRKPQIDHRLKEMDVLLDMISSGVFDPDVKNILTHCDTESVILAGHSFGAVTVGTMISSDYVPLHDHPDIKAVIMLDLWTRGRHWPDEISIRQNIPVFVCMSELFVDPTTYGQQFLPPLHVLCSKFNPLTSRVCWVEKLSHICFSDFGTFHVGFLRDHNQNNDVWTQALVDWLMNVLNDGYTGPLVREELVPFDGKLRVEWPDEQHDSWFPVGKRKHRNE